MHRRSTDRRGNYAALTALMMTVLLVFASFSLDWFRIRAANQQIQYAADAAALGALIDIANGGDAGSAMAVGDAVLDRNIVGEQRGGIRAEYTFGQYDWSIGDREDAWEPGAEPFNAVQVRAGRDNGAELGEIPLYLAPSFGGPSSAAVVGDSIAAIRYREVCIVLDLTGSFLEEMDDARDAVLGFLDYMNETGSPGDRICMVTFTGGSITYTPLTYVQPNYEGIRDDWEELEICDFWYTHWDKAYRPFYRYFSDFTRSIPWARNHPNMIGCHWGNQDIPGWPGPGEKPRWGYGGEPFYYSSGTNQSSGLSRARQILNASNNDLAAKVIVIISDGEPTCVDGDGCRDQRAAEGVHQSQLAQNEATIVFSVSFNYPYNATQSEYMESLASNGDQYFYETPDSDELPKILYTIARSIPTALVQ